MLQGFYSWYSGVYCVCPSAHRHYLFLTYHCPVLLLMDTLVTSSICTYSRNSSASAGRLADLSTVGGCFGSSIKNGIVQCQSDGFDTLCRSVSSASYTNLLLLWQLVNLISCHRTLHRKLRVKRRKAELLRSTKKEVEPSHLKFKAVGWPKLHTETCSMLACLPSRNPVFVRCTSWWPHPPIAWHSDRELDDKVLSPQAIFQP